MYTFERLEGERVRLEPLEPGHAEPLLRAALPPDIWRHYPIAIRGAEDMARFIEGALAARERGEQYPFAVYDKTQGAYVGSTRYLRIAPEHRNLNIGSTWYNPSVWRTRVNTETKYLMLRYAFETLGVCRVELITTPDNVRSQRAIERLGAVKEGVLRKKYRGLDYVVYGITDEDWPDVRYRMERFLERQAR